MNPLMLWRLKKFCDEHELDDQEIDDQLTYWENKEYLKTLVTDVNVELNYNVWRAEEKRYNVEARRYHADNFLKYYLHAVKMGETKSADVGPPIPPIRRDAFSLKAFTQKKT